MNKKFYKKTKILDSTNGKEDEIVTQPQSQNSTLLFSKLASSAPVSTGKVTPSVVEAQSAKTKGKRGRVTGASEKEKDPSAETQPKKGKVTKLSTGSDGNIYLHIFESKDR